MSLETQHGYYGAAVVNLFRTLMIIYDIHNSIFPKKFYFGQIIELYLHRVTRSMLNLERQHHAIFTLFFLTTWLKDRLFVDRVEHCTLPATGHGALEYISSAYLDSANTLECHSQTCTCLFWFTPDHNRIPNSKFTFYSILFKFYSISNFTLKMQNSKFKIHNSNIGIQSSKLQDPQFDRTFNISRVITQGNSITLISTIINNYHPPASFVTC